MEEKRILINARHPEEKRVAIARGRQLTDFYVEVASVVHLRGNVYKGIIRSVDRGLQAAFVDFGPKKHGFLALRDVMPESYAEKTKSKSPQITDVLRKGQEIIVQVERDERDTKGASLTNRISLPGRYLVMMPGKERLGISRKIEDPKARERLQAAFKDLKTPKNMGFILRTAGMDRTTEELAADLKYLTKLWNKIKREGKKAQAPCLIYREEDIAVRTVRDYLTTDVGEVIVDDKEAHKAVKSFLKLTMPWRATNLTLYQESRPIFDQYDLEDQITALNDRRVGLPSGGSIVIDKTEALTAIDVNSGKAKGKGIKTLALKTDLEAADEIARQLRLRDIGGLIVIDFIDTESAKNDQKIEERLRQNLNRDKAHYDMTRISKLGMLELSRERMRTAYVEAMNRPCPTCQGAGVVRSPELVAHSALRSIHSLAAREGVREVRCRLPVESANHVMNQLRESLGALEGEFSLQVTLMADPTMPSGQYAVEAEGGKSAQKKAEKRTKKEQTKTPEPAKTDTESAGAGEETAGKPKKKRRSRSGAEKRRRRKAKAAAMLGEETPALNLQQGAGRAPEVIEEPKAPTAEAGEPAAEDTAEMPKKKRRSRSGAEKRRRRKAKAAAIQAAPESEQAVEAAQAAHEVETQALVARGPTAEETTTRGEAGAKKKQSPRRRAARKKSVRKAKPAAEKTAAPEPVPGERAEELPAKPARKKTARKKTSAPKKPRSGGARQKVAVATATPGGYEE